MCVCACETEWKLYLLHLVITSIINLKSPAVNRGQMSEPVDLFLFMPPWIADRLGCGGLQVPSLWRIETPEVFQYIHCFRYTAATHQRCQDVSVIEEGGQIRTEEGLRSHVLYSYCAVGWFFQV